MSFSRRTWRDKFRDAFRGVRLGVRSEISFAVHLPVAVAVVVLAAWLQVSLPEWCLLILCITLVLAFELFNSALERLAKAIDTAHHPQLEQALDMASGAVLLAAAGAAVLGSLILGFRAFGAWIWLTVWWSS